MIFFRVLNEFLSFVLKSLFCLLCLGLNGIVAAGLEASGIVVYEDWGGI